MGSEELNIKPRIEKLQVWLLIQKLMKKIWGIRKIEYIAK